MSDYPVTRGSRAGDPPPRLRLAALTAVIAGVMLVALAAFLLSYEGIHQIALQAGVSPALAKLYPLMLDAMLVVACSAALALRNAGWWTKFYVWLSLLLLLGAMAAGDALHATGVRLTTQPARAVIAIIPWVLLLMGFGMWLVMLRQWRKIRAAAAASRTGVPSGTGAANGTGGSNGTGDGHTGQAIAGSAAAAGSATTWAGGRGAAPAATGAHRAGMDTLLERPADLAPDRAPAPEAQAAESRPTPGDKPALPRRPPVLEQRIPAGAAGAIGARAAAARATAASAAAAGAARARRDAAGATGTTETASTGTTEAASTETATTEAASTETAGTRTTGTATTEAASTETAGTRTTGTATTGTASTGAPSSGIAGAGAAGASAAGPDGGHAESPESRDGAGRGDGGLPSGAMAEDDSSFRLLPTQTKARVEGTTPGEDSEPHHAASPAATGDQGGPPPPVAPEPTLVPHFDRMHSTPTPPGDDGE